MTKSQLDIHKDGLAIFQLIQGCLNAGIFFGEHAEALGQCKAFIKAQVEHQEKEIAKLEAEQPAPDLKVVPEGEVTSE